MFTICRMTFRAAGRRNIMNPHSGYFSSRSIMAMVAGSGSSRSSHSVVTGACVMTSASIQIRHVAVVALGRSADRRNLVGEFHGVPVVVVLPVDHAAEFRVAVELS